MADEIAAVGGIDTHTDLHQAAVIDSIGRHLATEQFETTPEGIPAAVGLAPVPR
ncbi:hypothetical protein [Streptomyces sp. NPDC088141]|uniref:hypothetical protein n=1 Tax=Streptomyces sp. NPDC088141 TaxID=3155179 RepID=UPI00342EE698